ncbi:LysE family translocator [Tepidamorphus sp. 3E244]|uniref:LysE family translocator n=1 Tax=Tepidamorphus sp. 3E244 TaxID=3385498 RepID=UPI0038FC47CB
MFAFVAAVFLLIITPGPGVLSIAGVGSAFGFRPGFAYLAGLGVGNSAVALAVVSGVAAIVLAEPTIRTVLLFASITYLLYLAAKIAFSGSKIAFIEADKAPGFINGLMLQAINPKCYAVNTTLFTGFRFWPESVMAETLVKLLLMNALWIPIHFAWLYAGVTLKRLDLAPGTQRAINIAMALSMLAVVALAALR